MIKTIGIIGGRGMMGQMFVPAFESLGCEVMVSGSYDQHLEKTLVKECEMVIISSPLDKSVEVIHRIKGWLKQGQLISDFTSVKTGIVPEMLKTDADVISTHPMFGRVNDIKGNNVIILPVRPGKWQHKVERLYKSLELNTTVLQDWKEHDKMMSLIQGLMHFIHITFSHALEKSGVDLDLLLSICSPVYQANFAFACRILQRDPSLYGHILMDNPQNTQVIKHFLDEAHNSLKTIENKDFDGFNHQFAKTKDFLGTQGEVFSKQSDFLVEMLKSYQPPNK